MKYLNFIILLFVLFLLLYFNEKYNGALAPAGAPVIGDGGDLTAIVGQPRNGLIPLSLIDLLKDTGLYNLAICESNLNQNTIGKAGEIGILQFKQTTFNEYKNKYNLPNFDINNSYHQIILAKIMIENGLGKKWTCKI